MGKILLCQTSINWYRAPIYYEGSWRGTKALDGGAALINQGIHTIDLMLNLMGEVSVISGFIDTLNHRIEGLCCVVARIRRLSCILRPTVELVSVRHISSIVRVALRVSPIHNNRLNNYVTL